MNILAIDIGGTAIKIGTLNDKINFTAFEELPTNANLGAQALMETVRQAAGRFSGFSAIGVSTAMQVDPQTGTITHATDTFPGYTGTRVKAILEERFSVPVAVENDANAVAIAEGAFGAARDYSTFLSLVYGTGIGGGLVLDGQLYRGSGFSAGEVGHMRLHAGGKRCNCGLLGCYEAYASARILTETASRQFGRPMDGRQLCALLHGGDPLAKEVVDSWLQEVVWGLSSLIQIFDPPCVVIGGGIMEDPYMLPKIRELLPGELMESFRAVKVLQARMGNRAGMIGAAHLAAQLLATM